jgi:hypothetical protein
MIGVPLVEKLSRTSFGAKNKRGKSDPEEEIQLALLARTMDADKVQ